MRQNVPLRKPGSAEADTERASRSIDEWLDAAVAEQSRRQPAASTDHSAPAEQALAQPLAAELPQTRISPSTSAKSSTALNSMTSWIERAQEELAEVGKGPDADTQSYARTTASRPSYDALSAVERLDTGLGLTDSRSDAQAAQDQAFRNLENRIREIAGRLDMSSNGSRAKPAPRQLEAAVAEIRARQAALDEEPRAAVQAEPPPPPPSLRAPAPPSPALPPETPAPSRPPVAPKAAAKRTTADPLATFHTEIDRLPGSPGGSTPPAIPSGLEGLKRDIDRVQASMAALATRSDLNAVERSIGALAGEIAEARARGGSLVPVEAEVEALQAEVQRLGAHGRSPGEGLGKLARDIDIVSHKLDIVAASGIDPAAIGALGREIADVKRMLGAMAAPADLGALGDQLNEMKLELARIGSRQVDAQDFTSFRIAFEEMRDALSLGAGQNAPALSISAVQNATKDELQPIASMLVMLIEKIERLERHSGDPEMVEQIERQIAGLSATIGSTAARDPGLADLSHAMSDLMSEVASWRDGTVEIAEQAARNAVAQTIEAMRGEFAPSDAATPRPGFAAADDVPSRAAPEQQAESQRAAVEPVASPPVRDAKPASDEADRPREMSDAALRRLNEAMLLGPTLTEADRPLPPRAPENEVLLEPGAGRPRSVPHVVPEPEMSGDQRDIKASFIAAARRAAQAAAADAEKSKGRTADRTTAIPADKGQGQAKIRAMLDRLRRPLLVSAAALVVAIGSYRLASELAAEDPAQLLANLATQNSSLVASAPVITAPAANKVAAVTPPAEVPEPNTTASVPAPREANASAAPQQSPAPQASAVPESVAASSAPNAAAATPEPSSQKQASQLPAAGPGAPLPAKPASDAAAGASSLRQAALNGDPVALYELAIRTMDGRGVARDPRAAVALFEKAGEKNLAPAQYRAGNAYEKGIGVPRDVEAARRWYQRAAENGNTRAMHNLAVLMAEGAGGKPDYAAAMTWFSKASEHGVRDSQFNLAVLFARGLGTQLDLVRSYTWFAVAASQGDDEAGRKRDEVAARLQPADLARAKAAVERWRMTPPNPTANEVPPTAAKWSYMPGRRSGRA
jgi:localization factor PodJL